VQQIEVGRKELFIGSGIFVVTVEQQAFKIITNGACEIEVGPYETEADALLASENLEGSIVAPYAHRFSYYERFGERVE